MPGYILYTWGAIPFEVYPLGLDSVQHSTETDWARKEIAGAAIHHEHVGENEEELTFAGRCFPHFFANFWRGGAARQTAPTRVAAIDPVTGQPTGVFNPVVQPTPRRSPSSGGLGHLEVLDNMRRLGQVHVLIRGDGWHLGWFAIKTLRRAHSHLGPEGVGQMIQFEVLFTRFPIPSDPSPYFSSVFGATMGS